MTKQAPNTIDFVDHARNALELAKQGDFDEAFYRLSIAFDLTTEEEQVAFVDRTYSEIKNIQSQMRVAA